MRRQKWIFFLWIKILKVYVCFFVSFFSFTISIPTLPVLTPPVSSWTRSSTRVRRPVVWWTAFLVHILVVLGSIPKQGMQLISGGSNVWWDRPTVSATQRTCATMTQHTTSVLRYGPPVAKARAGSSQLNKTCCDRSRSWVSLEQVRSGVERLAWDCSY